MVHVWIVGLVFGLALLAGCGGGGGGGENGGAPGSFAAGLSARGGSGSQTENGGNGGTILLRSFGGCEYGEGEIFLLPRGAPAVGPGEYDGTVTHFGSSLFVEANRTVTKTAQDVAKAWTNVWIEGTLVLTGSGPFEIISSNDVLISGAVIVESPPATLVIRPGSSGDANVLVSGTIRISGATAGVDGGTLFIGTDGTDPVVREEKIFENVKITGTIDCRGGTLPSGGGAAGGSVNVFACHWLVHEGVINVDGGAGTNGAGGAAGSIVLQDGDYLVVRSDRIDGHGGAGGSQGGSGGAGGDLVLGAAKRVEVGPGVRLDLPGGAGKGAGNGAEGGGLGIAADFRGAGSAEVIFGGEFFAVGGNADSGDAGRGGYFSIRTGDGSPGGDTVKITGTVSLDGGESRGGNGGKGGTAFVEALDSNSSINIDGEISASGGRPNGSGNLIYLGEDLNIAASGQPYPEAPSSGRLELSGALHANGRGAGTGGVIDFHIHDLVLDSAVISAVGQTDGQAIKRSQTNQTGTATVRDGGATPNAIDVRDDRP